MVWIPKALCDVCVRHIPDTLVRFSPIRLVAAENLDELRVGRHTPDSPPHLPGWIFLWDSERRGRHHALQALGNGPVVLWVRPVLAVLSCAPEVPGREHPGRMVLDGQGAAGFRGSLTHVCVSPSCVGV